MWKEKKKTHQNAVRTHEKFQLTAKKDPCDITPMTTFNRSVYIPV